MVRKIKTKEPQMLPPGASSLKEVTTILLDGVSAGVRCTLPVYILQARPIPHQDDKTHEFYITDFTELEERFSEAATIVDGFGMSLTRKVLKVKLDQKMYNKFTNDLLNMNMITWPAVTSVLALIDFEVSRYESVMSYDVFSVTIFNSVQDKSVFTPLITDFQKHADLALFKKVYSRLSGDTYLRKSLPISQPVLGPVSQPVPMRLQIENTQPKRRRLGIELLFKQAPSDKEEPLFIETQLLEDEVESEEDSEYVQSGQLMITRELTPLNEKLEQEQIKTGTEWWQGTPSSPSNSDSFSRGSDIGLEVGATNIKNGEGSSQKVFDLSLLENKNELEVSVESIPLEAVSENMPLQNSTQNTEGEIDNIQNRQPEDETRQADGVEDTLENTQVEETQSEETHEEGTQFEDATQHAHLEDGQLAYPSQLTGQEDFDLSSSENARVQVNDSKDNAHVSSNERVELNGSGNESSLNTNKSSTNGHILNGDDFTENADSNVSNTNSNVNSNILNATSITPEPRPRILVASVCKTPFTLQQISTNRFYELNAKVVRLLPHRELVIKSYGRTLKVSDFKLVLGDSQASMEVEFHTEEEICNFLGLLEIEDITTEFPTIDKSLTILLNSGSVKPLQVRQKLTNLDNGYSYSYWHLQNTLAELV